MRSVTVRLSVCMLARVCVCVSGTVLQFQVFPLSCSDPLSYFLLFIYICQILQLLQWLDRFWDVCSLLPADSQGVSVLSLHWQWVQKHLILRLPQLLLGEGCNTFEYNNTTIN